MHQEYERREWTSLDSAAQWLMAFTIGGYAAILKSNYNALVILTG
ncbi:hypothetical protein [Marinomonas transparens]|nr:hypothetical protein [Marinomonas transparens]